MNPGSIPIPRIIILILFLGLSSLVVTAEIHASGDIPKAISPSKYEAQVLALVNEARAGEGLPALSHNGNLYLAARSQSRDVFKNGLKDRGQGSVDERLRKRGYIPGTTGEAMASLVFRNYIKPGDAAKILFEQMYKNELDACLKSDQNILNPDLEEVGISFRSGRVKISGKRYNGYLLVADFATPLLSSREHELLELINQARENPKAVARSLGIDTESLVGNLPESKEIPEINEVFDLKEIFEGGLPPFNPNETLFAAARAHARDMLENVYYSHESLDARTVEDRIKEQGYTPLSSGELLGFMASAGYMEAADIARLLFEANFKAELGQEMGGRNILNPELKEAGVSFTVTAMENGDGFCATRHLLVADFAANEDEKKAGPFLTGVAYKDLDGNGLYSPGEGLANIQVSVTGSGKSLDLFTNRAGGFQVALPPGSYRALCYLPDSVAEARVVIKGENAGVRFSGP